MRKARGKYKICCRLGYNARLRYWQPGTRKKWETSVRWGSQPQHSSRDTGETRVKVRNPARPLTNAERRGRTTWTTSTRKKGKAVIRRKDRHGRVQSQKTGRKLRYGNVSSQIIRKSLLKQRDSYQTSKSRNERRYRKGYVELSPRFHSDPVDTSRRSGTETRVDRRRWRSGRVPTIQMARHLVEHGNVERIESNQATGTHLHPITEIKWQGAAIEVGEGRKIQEKAWLKRKERSKGLVEKPEYGMHLSKYREVDYVTGIRVLIRKPTSGDVGYPKGMELFVSTYR